jgi:phosphoglycolate phosphatase
VPYRLVIFDFDGTLADSFAVSLDLWDELAAKHRFKPFDRSQAQLLRGLDSRELMRLHEVPTWKIPLIVRSARTILSREIGRIQLFPGIDQAIEHLIEHGVTVAIATTNSRKNVLAVLGARLSSRIAMIEAGAPLFGKAARLRKLLRVTKTPVANAILIGDEKRDAVAAQQAGIAFGAVAWGFATLESLRQHQPVQVFNAVPDLRALVD